MAKYEKMLYGDFQELLDRLHQAVMDGSMTASYEEGSDYHQDGFDCAIRVYDIAPWEAIG